jgi:hypothetical protein
MRTFANERQNTAVGVNVSHNQWIQIGATADVGNQPTLEK